MPNLIAYAAVGIWPIAVFYMIRRYGFESGVLMGLLGAYMFLPAGFDIDLPGLPAFDKFSITVITLIAYLVLHKKPFGYLGLSKAMRLVFLAFLISPFLTSVTNTERYFYLPGLSLYDGLSDSIHNFLYIFPFLIGVKYFRSFESQQLIFKYFVIAAAIYAVLALWEIRMSPQLHSTLYGYFPHSWLQQYRGGGFRAIVFMGHGLLVAFFLALGLAFVSAMNKTRTKSMRVNNFALLLFIMATLILSKSLAALVFGLFAFLMITFMGNKLMHFAALAIAAMFLSYPIMSSMNLFPHRTIMNYANAISPERAESLGYRFEHEEKLLKHANSKSLFGWGGWGRNRVRDEMTGQDTSTTDGKWIITLGVRGWFGYISEFLFIVVPIWLSFRIRSKAKHISKKESIFLASHVLIVSLILLDQMPNASLNPLYWLVAGALLGRVYDLKEQAINIEQEEKEDKESVSNSSTLLT
ncbi:MULTISPECIES: hypothetical protein [unclassified Methylophaga]|jgi:hypothetical protein|uniref:hypothetical protein n=1 Tax=unclassified Methylophaga TaxID=2629249 RepID=UPI0025EB2875|nr:MULTISPECIES: hypothetical protein [unclassified Methylophaga]|tara:strand:+ start:9138 stop:10541 length:1404 start_codon:yes stop_codon:yes gene_type:complete